MSNVRVRNQQHLNLSDVVARAKWLGQGASAAVQVPASDKPEASRSVFIRGGLGVVAFVVGTGGLLTADYIACRNDRGYRFQEFDFKAPKPKANLRQLIRSSAANLAHVRQVFKPSVKDLAEIFGVSRQAIYNWQAGQPVAAQNELRLEELAKAADVLSREGVADGARLLSRKLPGGKTMLEAIRDGMEAEQAARTLLSILEDEMRQRETFSRRLSHRIHKPVDVSTIGSPHIDESV